MLFLKNKLKGDRFASDQDYAQYEYELTKRVIIPLLKSAGFERIDYYRGTIFTAERILVFIFLSEKNNRNL